MNKEHQRSEPIARTLTSVLGRLSFSLLLCLTHGVPGQGVIINSVTRCANNPLITPEASPTIRSNINGPAVIRVPSWLPNPLGTYYMYFGHHGGKFIRLAYADALKGPWTVYEPGTLQLTDVASTFKGHIASPDIYLDSAARKVYLFYHGLANEGGQQSGVAVSSNGIDFTPAYPQPVTEFYFRVFEWRHFFYGVSKHGKDASGMIHRSSQVDLPYTAVKDIIPHQRHAAVLRKRRLLCVFYSRIGDVPERILLSTVDLGRPPTQWEASEPLEVIRPEHDYEGVNYPIEPSVPAGATGVHQLRDPGIFEENGRYYLFYSIAGEEGIAMAELELTFSHDDTVRAFDDTAYAFDDFQGGELGASWQLVDRDGWDGSRVSVSSGTLSLNGTGNALDRRGNEFLGIWRNDIRGDFDAMVKIVSLDSTDADAQCGILVANDINDDTQGGLVRVATTAGGTCCFMRDDSDPVGLFDHGSNRGEVRYPCWLRLLRQRNTYSAYYRSAGSALWEPVFTSNWSEDLFATPLQSTADPVICLFMSSNSDDAGVAVVDSFQCWGLDRPLSYRGDGLTVLPDTRDRTIGWVNSPNGARGTGNRSALFSLDGRRVSNEIVPAPGFYLLWHGLGNEAAPLPWCGEDAHLPRFDR